MSRQNLSIANLLYYGKAAFGRAFDGKRGIPVNLLTVVDFGAPAAAAANNICASQGVTPPATGVINGALASGGVATLDKPRNVVAAWTTAAVITVTGTDEYGETLKESSASGTSFTGKKAFKTVTAVDFSVAVTAATVGTGTVLGLPVKVTASHLLAARHANAIDAGTFVPSDTTTPTALTGDIRGTFAPAGALNGSNVVCALVYCSDPYNKAAAYGATQFNA